MDGKKSGVKQVHIVPNSSHKTHSGISILGVQEKLMKPKTPMIWKHDLEGN